MSAGEVWLLISVSFRLSFPYTPKIPQTPATRVGIPAERQEGNSSSDHRYVCVYTHTHTHKVCVCVCYKNNSGVQGLNPQCL